MEGQDKQEIMQQLFMDSHTHLLDYQASHLTAIITNAINNNVCKIVVNSTTSKQYQPMKKLYKQNNKLIVPGFGVHPYFVSEEMNYQEQKEDGQKVQWKDKLVSYLQQDQNYTVGEIGLDFRKDVLDNNPKQLQLEIFMGQLNLAIQLKRPVTIHCVRAHGEMLKLFKTINKKVESYPNIIMHSYGGSKQITKSLLKLSNLNIFFSLSLKRSAQLYQVIPLDRIICETDSPCQNNIELLQQMESLHKNIHYHELLKQSNSYSKQYIDNESNEPVNVIANIESASRIYSKALQTDEKTIIKTIFHNSMRAFKLIK